MSLSGDRLLELLQVAARLISSLVSVALVAVVGVNLIMGPRRLLPQLDYLLVNTAAGERVNVPPRLDLVSEVVLAVQYDVPVLWYIPTAFGLFLRASKREWAVIAGTATLTYPAFRLYFYRNFSEPSILLPILTSAAAVALVTRSVAVTLFCMKIWGTLLIGIALLLFLRNFPSTTDSARIFVACVVFPLLREITYMTVRSVSRAMALHDQGSLNRNVRRNVAFMMFSWFQVSIALLIRLLFSRFQSTNALVFAVLFQSVSEVTSRLTMAWRDRKFADITRSLCKCRAHRRENVAIVAPSEILKTAAEPVVGEVLRKEGVALARSRTEILTSARRFHAMVVVGEMLSEYVAIFHVLALILIYDSARLVLPLDFFAGMDNPFGGRLDVAGLCFNVILQLLAEVLVDVVCIIVEYEQSYPLAEVWNARPRRFGFLAIWSTWFAATIMVPAVDRDKLRNCFAADLCVCANGNGLDLNGLRQRYCDFLNATNNET